MSRVPIIQLNGRYYYRDKRLQQLRAIDNYLDSMEWTDLITAVAQGLRLNLGDAGIRPVRRGPEQSRYP